ncbi:MAG: hypothetical protein ACRD8O_11320 [Bryobacteraceae bacterium]
MKWSTIDYRLLAETGYHAKEVSAPSLTVLGRPQTVAAIGFETAKVGLGWEICSQHQAL